MNTKKLKSIMSSKGVSSKALAQQVGVSEAFVGYLLRGQKVPSVRILKCMADYLGTTMDELV